MSNKCEANLSVCPLSNQQTNRQTDRPTEGQTDRELHAFDIDVVALPLIRLPQLKGGGRGQGLRARAAVINQHEMNRVRWMQHKLQLTDAFFKCLAITLYIYGRTANICQATHVYMLEGVGRGACIKFIALLATCRSSKTAKFPHLWGHLLMQTVRRIKSCFISKIHLLKLSANTPTANATQGQTHTHARGARTAAASCFLLLLLQLISAANLWPSFD